MKIFKVDTNQFKDEFEKVCNAEYSSSKNREKAIDDCRKSHAVELTPKEFLTDNDYKRKHWYMKQGISFYTEGEPENLIEAIINFELNGNGYAYTCDNFPEDMIESRTDWNDLKWYCDEYSSFFDQLLDMAKYED